jgi:hypothetical protein
MASRSEKELSHSLQLMRVVLPKLMRWDACHTSIQAVHGASSGTEHGCSAGSAVVILVMLMKMRISLCAKPQMIWTWAPRAAAHPLGRNMLSRLMHYNRHQTTTLVLSSPHDGNLNSESCLLNCKQNQLRTKKCSISSRTFYRGIYFCSFQSSYSFISLQQQCMYILTGLVDFDCVNTDVTW